MSEEIKKEETVNVAELSDEQILDVAEQFITDTIEKSKKKKKDEKKEEKLGFNMFIII